MDPCGGVRKLQKVTVYTSKKSASMARGYISAYMNPCL